MRVAILSRRKRGISELVGTVLTIAITIITGTAVFGYVNGQAGVSENAYGQAVGATVQFLEERYVVAQFSFSSGVVTAYIYNDGRINLHLAQIEIYDSAKSSIDTIFSASGATDLLHSGCTVATPSVVESPVLGTGGGAFSLAANSVSSLALTLPKQSMNSMCPAAPTWVSGTSYYAKITAEYGNQAVYYQVD